MWTYRKSSAKSRATWGWARKEIATKGQTVRGIIVTGGRDERLEYSLVSIPNIHVVYWLDSVGKWKANRVEYSDGPPTRRRYPDRV